MTAEQIIEEARLKQIEGRWKSDVDLKLDSLVAFAKEYEDLLKMLIRREREREALRKSIIEKTLTALVIAAVGWAISLAWHGLTSDIKDVVTTLRGK